MTWFATAMMSITWFHAVNDGFENLDVIHGGAARDRFMNKRMLKEVELNGLARKQLTLDEANGLAIMPSLRVIVIFVFPILAYVFIVRNYFIIGKRGFKEMFGTLYTDMIIKNSAQHTIALLCSRRMILVLTTVFLNCHFVPNLVVYCYGTILLLAYYFFQRPFDNKWAYYLEVLNESFVAITAYFCLIFTDWYRDIQTKY